MTRFTFVLKRQDADAWQASTSVVAEDYDIAVADALERGAKRGMGIIALHKEEPDDAPSD